MRHLGWRSSGVLVLLAACAIAAPAPAQGLLATLREDVRTSSGGQSRRSRADDGYEDWYRSDDAYYGSPLKRGSHGEENASNSLGFLVGMAALAPFYLPKAMLDDDYIVDGYFSRCPYDYGPTNRYKSAYMVLGACAPDPRTAAGRFQFEFGQDFDTLDRHAGRLLLSTTSRWGLDLAADHFEERLLSAARYDTLWLGDANVIFRFTQSRRSQWRVGLGFNWLSDRTDTDFGFNFTYGVDFFPAKPWVLSATLDAGALGHSGLFRFRATAGIAVRHVEPYVGYEYLDVGRLHSNALVTGVQVWF